MKNVSGLEAVYQDYKDQDVVFHYVYKSLAHPEINNFVAPHTLEERLLHIARFKEITGSQIPWICDSMDNMFANAFGGAPNGEFVIDPEGIVVRQRFWSNPKTLRADLAAMLGPVQSPTSPEQALPGFEMPRSKVASGVVPALALPGGLRPLLTTPAESDLPAFAKLRVEGSASLLGEDRKGSLYLGLYLDPLYQVHWNNRAGDVLIQVTTPDGMEISQSSLKGPQVKEDADIDPRQFLVELDRKKQDGPLTISVTYTVCDDAETFCHTVTQDYEVEFRTDREFGSRPGTFMPGMFARVMQLDRNGDGRIEGDEFPPQRATLFLSHMDRNLDQVIDRAEVEAFFRLFNNGRGFESPYDDGNQPANDRAPF